MNESKPTCGWNESAPPFEMANRCKDQAMSGEKTHENLKDVIVRSGDWFSCPFCGSTGITSEFTSFGTTLTCNCGCHGEFTFPALEAEVMALWKRTKRRQDYKRAQRKDEGL